MPPRNAHQMAKKNIQDSMVYMLVGAVKELSTVTGQRKVQNEGSIEGFGVRIISETA